jgi:light-regulated signal transduction histidine kinase (bacteriophytochrome)
MMDALIAYSRSGSQALSLCPVDVKRLVAEVCAEIEAARPCAGCKIEIGDLPGAYADESMLRVIWSNLISNACKFVRPGEPPHVEVAGQLSGEELVYRVRDRGIGFDMRYAERLFAVFERLHGAEGYAGHGVGLAIVARLVRRHGGRIWAQSAPGKGATFYFSVALPREAGDARA